MATAAAYCWSANWSTAVTAQWAESPNSGLLDKHGLASMVSLTGLSAAVVPTQSATKRKVKGMIVFKEIAFIIILSTELQCYPNARTISVNFMRFFVSRIIAG